MDRTDTTRNTRIHWLRPEDFNRRDQQAAKPRLLALVPIRWAPGPIIA